MWAFGGTPIRVGPYGPEALKQRWHLGTVSFLLEGSYHTLFLGFLTLRFSDPRSGPSIRFVAEGGRGESVSAQAGLMS